MFNENVLYPAQYNTYNIDSFRQKGRQWPRQLNAWPSKFPTALFSP